MALGADLAEPVKPPQKPVAPESNGFAKAKDGLGAMLKRPEVLAMLLQTSASLLQGADIGQALGEGGQAVGRFGKAKADAEGEKRRQMESDREYQLRVDQLELQRQNAARGGGGGGRGSGGGSTAGLPMKVGALADMLYKDDLAAWEAEQENAEVGAEPSRPRPDRLSYQVTAQMVDAAVQNGMPLQYYSELRRTGGYAQADQLAQMFVNDPAEGKRVIENFQNPMGQATTPDASYSPDPLAMPSPSPAAPAVSPLPGFGGVGQFAPQPPIMNSPTTGLPISNTQLPNVDPMLLRQLGYLGVQ